MKFSICIPQYNRIDFLLISLDYIAQLNYTDLEVIVSDDCSTDDTAAKITALQPQYPFPLVYHRFETNQGYDRNLRNSIELATGDYCFILGNDDTIKDVEALNVLAAFLKANNYPEIGFCNNRDYVDAEDIAYRAHETAVIGSGIDIALKYYSSFSFVAGLIFNKKAFDAVNTNRYDGSIYVQIYLAMRIMMEGGRLFVCKEAWVSKDIRVDGSIANSYRDTLPKTWAQYKVLDAGLPSYANVAISAIRDSGGAYLHYAAHIQKRIYKFTYPYWIVDYKRYGAYVAALGLVRGLRPQAFKYYAELAFGQRVVLRSLYMLASVAAFLMPVAVFNKVQKSLYTLAKPK